MPSTRSGRRPPPASGTALVALLATSCWCLAAGLAWAQAPVPEASTPPAPAPAPTPLKVPYQMFTLPNGLEVVLHEDHRVPVVTVDAWYHAGSGREKPGRTGFAHLFEHLMFEGSEHVPEGEFDNLLEAAGGDNNGTTSEDRTEYYITVPSNVLELALFLESDRMGYLLPTMSPTKVDGQRDVVKNERRQAVENVPYGKVEDVLPELLYPKGHPYSWPVIGSMADLTAASYDDVVEFFKTYYVPGNASLVVAGDIDPAQARALVEKWFSDVKPGAPLTPQSRPGVALEGVRRETITDRVQLPRLYLAWLTPAQYEPGDAALDVASYVLAGGKNSRLYKRLVYDLQIAQDVEATQYSAALGSNFQVVVTPRRPSGAQSGASDEELVSKVKAIVDEEIDRLRNEPPTPREVERALNQLEASFYNSLENLASKASRLNAYLVDATNADWFNEDLSRYRALDPTDIQAAVRMHLPADRRVELTVLPER